MESKTSHRRMACREKEEQALDMRRQGKSYRIIAAEMGCHPDTVFNWVKRAMARLMDRISEKAEEVRRLELERLDHMLACLSSQIDSGDTKAITTALRIQERRSKLCGLDAPPPKQQVEITSPEDLSPDRLRERLAQALGQQVQIEEIK